METTSTFPVSAGTVLSLTCNAGYELKGSNEVTCTQNTDYHFTDSEPFCGELYSDGISPF